MRVKLIKACLASVADTQTSGFSDTSTAIHSELQIVVHDLFYPTVDLRSATRRHAR